MPVMNNVARRIKKREDGWSMDESARKWMIKTAHQNIWRVLGWYDVDELIADGALCWQIVCNKYPEATERRHIMALFQRTYINHIHKLSNKQTRRSSEVSTDELPDMIPHADTDDSDLRELISEQTGAMRLLLSTLVDHPEVMLHPHRRWLGGRRQTTNEWLCSLIGLDPTQFSLEDRLRRLLNQ